MGADDGAYWHRCRLGFNSDAQVLAGDVWLTNRGAHSTLSGQLAVNSNCRVTGTFVQQFSAGGSLTCTIARTLSRDKEALTGVGKCSNGGGIFACNMVER